MMNKKFNILITGCEGDIATSIARIIKQENLASKLCGTDIKLTRLSSVYYEKTYIIPKANDSNYESKLFEIIDKEKIDIVIPTPEAELRVLLNNSFYNKRELFLTANEKTLSIGLDKYETVRLLMKNSLPYPKTYLYNDFKTTMLPCIVKNRASCGSKNLYIVNTENYDYLKNKLQSEDFIWQELLPDDDGYEYTCGLWRGINEDARVIIMKRKLLGGFTGSGIVVNNIKIEKLLLKLADLLELKGSINVQLRLRKDEPVIFEINPRFSSTVMFRHKMGFKDLIWSIQDRFSGTVDSYITPKEGTTFYKVFDELIFPENVDKE